MSDGVCKERTVLGYRCALPVLNPSSNYWRRYEPKRALEGLLAYCGKHAAARLREKRVLTGEDIGGMRRQLIEILREARGEWVPNHDIARALYTDDSRCALNGVRNLVCRIRQIDPTLIETMAGLGYRLRGERIEKEAS